MNGAGESVFQPAPSFLSNIHYITMESSRIFIAVGVILLGVAYLLPLWCIKLEAPQYPEPIGLYIFVNSIRGIGDHDLENINILNHYIGMKPIDPASVPELRFMPWILAVLIGGGIIAFIVSRRWTIAIWGGAIIVSGIVGLYDFNQWELEYGTNLDPHAPIKIEGMTYKPPLIGTKQLLNITAYSYPSWGGYAIALAVVASTIGFRCAAYPVIKHRNSSAKGKAADDVIDKAWAIMPLILLIIFTASSCRPSPEPIHYGTDQCELCKMTISDQRFGAEIVLKTGKVYKFDSIECMVNYLRTQHVDSASVALLLVIDFQMPGALIDARSAVYVRSDQVPSPMGADVSAYATRATALEIQSQYGGEVLSWDEVRQYIASLE